MRYFFQSEASFELSDEYQKMNSSIITSYKRIETRNASMKQDVTSMDQEIESLIVKPEDTKASLIKIKQIEIYVKYGNWMKDRKNVKS